MASAPYPARGSSSASPRAVTNASAATTITPASPASTSVSKRSASCGAPRPLRTKPFGWTTNAPCAETVSPAPAAGAVVAAVVAGSTRSRFATATASPS